MSTKHKSGLELDAPQSGAGADCYAVACTALMLEARKGVDIRRGFPDGEPPRFSARAAVTLHRLSGMLHRIAERQCNEPGQGCSRCQGTGEYDETAEGARKDCPACKGTGQSARERTLRAQAREIAEHYGLRAYFQTDPRGCALYLCEPAEATDQHYDRGHAVVRIGR